MGQSQRGREEGARLPHRYLAVQSTMTCRNSAGGDALCGAAPSGPVPPHPPLPVPSTCSRPCPAGRLLSLQGSGTPSTQPLLPVLRLVLQRASVGL